MNSNLKSLFITWLAWAVVITGFQMVVTARFQPQRPDYALQWTAGETKADSQDNKPYLIEPFLNTHVSWDSEYYLSIATAGYDDPLVRAIPPYFSWARMPQGPQAPAEMDGKVPSDLLSLNYAFLPFYPFVMRVVAFPFKISGLNSIAAATLAGILVSLLGTLGAMIALYDLASSYLDEEGGIRAAFYLLIFPSSMFLAQVYTEGLFVGLAFGALALLKHRKWLWAVLLAMCATWTRAAGGLLVIPFAWAWLEDGGWDAVSLNPTLSELGRALLVLSPLAAFLLWRVVLGSQFNQIESLFFGRGLLLIDQSVQSWTVAIKSMFAGNPQTTIYYGLEIAAILFGLLACGLTWRAYPGLSAYGAAAILFSLTSGAAQGMSRYILAAPSVFLILAGWGKHRSFDRAWTIASLLLMGMLVTLFSFDFWVG